MAHQEGDVAKVGDIVIEVTVVAGEDGPEKVLCLFHQGTLLQVKVFQKAVQRLEAVERPRVGAQQVTQVGGATAPGGQNHNSPHLRSIQADEHTYRSHLSGKISLGDKADIN